MIVTTPGDGSSTTSTTVVSIAPVACCERCFRLGVVARRRGFVAFLAVFVAAFLAFLRATFLAALLRPAFLRVLVPFDLALLVDLRIARLAIESPAKKFRRLLG